MGLRIFPLWGSPAAEAGGDWGQLRTSAGERPQRLYTLDEAVPSPTMKLLGVRFPISWEAFGFPSPFEARGTVVAEGRVAWAWAGDAPDFGIDTYDRPAGEDVAGWEVDHVVLLVPEIEQAVARLQEAGAELRLRMDVRARPTAFFRVGTVLEVIETNVPVPGLYGVALATAEPLEEVAARWRAGGHDVSEAREAIQPGRRIFTVRGLDSGLVVMDVPA